MTAKKQSNFLMRRGIVDELTCRVLARAIEKRNRVEHEYVRPELDVAEDIVELLRRTITAITTHSDPAAGPWIYGTFLYSLSGSRDGVRVEFRGWTGPLMIFSRSRPRPWVGLVIPSSESDAVVRQASLEDVGTEQLLQLLSLAEKRFGPPIGCFDLHACAAFEREMGVATVSAVADGA